MGRNGPSHVRQQCVAGLLAGPGEFHMNFRCFRLVLAGCVAAAAFALETGQAPAQSPAASPSPAPSPPSHAAEAAPPAAATQPADPFGEEITLEAKKVIIAKGTANWDAAFDTLVETLRTLNAFLDKQGIKPSGNAMIVYTSTDDNGFTFLAEIPVEQEP